MVATKETGVTVRARKSPAARWRESFAAGDLALLIDRKSRRYMVTLGAGEAFHTHLGPLPHDDIIGREQGITVRTVRGHALLVLKPTLADYIMEMPRGSQIVYPKDLGNILVMADIFPGATVVEAGLGSGALTAALLRAVGANGKVVTYEVREDMARRGMKNLRALEADQGSHRLRMGDIYRRIWERKVDRMVLDVPEPWHVVPHAARALVMGGIFLSFLPTVLQVHRLAQALAQEPRFQLVETTETLLRPWSVTQRSMRPAHRMVAHSGFITTARKCAPRGQPVAPPPWKGEGGAEEF